MPGKQDRHLSIPIHIVLTAVRCLRGLGLYQFVCAKERGGSKYKIWLQAASWELASKLAIQAYLHRGSVDQRDESCSCLRIGVLTTLSGK